MTKTKHIGRPKLPENTAKTAVLTIRLSEEDRAHIAAAAVLAGVSQSQWIRKTLLQMAKLVKSHT